MGTTDIEDRARSFERLAEHDNSKAARHALLGNHHLATFYAELSIESRAEARDLRGTAGIKYTGRDIYFEGATA